MGVGVRVQRTVLDNSLPASIMRKHNGIISVWRRKLMTSGSSIYVRMRISATFFVGKKRTLTSAPMTPKLVSRRYSKGRFLLTVFKNGYRYNGICAGNPFTVRNYIQGANPRTIQERSSCVVVRCNALK